MPKQQQGVVLFISLIILIAMTLAGIALIRSTDLGNIVAGNLAFKQAATHAGDRGIEKALEWLNNNPTLLSSDVPSAGYSANGKDALRSPSAGQSWEGYWKTLATGRVWTLSAADVGNSGNTVSLVIDRMCETPGASSESKCTNSTVAGISGGGAEEGGEKTITASSAVYYRITARIAGPRNTLSFVQAMVTL